MADALTFLGGFLLFVAVASVMLPVAVVLLIGRLWGYTPDALEVAAKEVQWNIDTDDLRIGSLLWNGERGWVVIVRLLPGKVWVRPYNHLSRKAI